MKERLWKEQSVFKRTMETYENAMTAQTEEMRDIAATYRKVRYWKVRTHHTRTQNKRFLVQRARATLRFNSQITSVVFVCVYDRK